MSETVNMGGGVKCRITETYLNLKDQQTIIIIYIWLLYIYAIYTYTDICYICIYIINDYMWLLYIIYMYIYLKTFLYKLHGNCKTKIYIRYTRNTKDSY